MVNPREVLERIAPKLRALVARERKACGCAKTAMKRVASKIAASPMWIYRVANGYSQRTIVQAHHFLNIEEAFARIHGMEQRAVEVVVSRIKSRRHRYEVRI